MLDYRAEHWRDSNDYRKSFFRRNKAILGAIWLCSQCWVPLLGNSNVQVDHIVPPSKAIRKNSTKKNSILATWMNTEINTSPICPKCNGIKSNKIGFWFIVKGFATKIIHKVAGTVQDVFIIAAFLILLCMHLILRFVVGRILPFLAAPKSSSKRKSSKKFSFKNMLMPLLMIGLVIFIIYFSTKL